MTDPTEEKTVTEELIAAARNAVDHLQSLVDRGHANDLTYVRLGELEAAIARATQPEGSK